MRLSLTVRPTHKPKGETNPAWRSDPKWYSYPTFEASEQGEAYRKAFDWLTLNRKAIVRSSVS